MSKSKTNVIFRPLPGVTLFGEETFVAEMAPEEVAVLLQSNEIILDNQTFAIVNIRSIVFIDRVRRTPIASPSAINDVHVTLLQVFV